MLINAVSFVAALSLAVSALAAPTPSEPLDLSPNPTVAERQAQSPPPNEWRTLCARPSGQLCLGVGADGGFRLYPRYNSRTTWFRNGDLTNIVKDGNWQGFMTGWNVDGLPVITSKNWGPNPPLLQQWEWVNNAVRGQGTNLCLDVRNGAFQEGTIVQTWPCVNYSANQQWTLY